MNFRLLEMKIKISSHMHVNSEELQKSFWDQNHQGAFLIL